MSKINNLAGLKAALQTLGCKLNFAETATIEDKLRAEGVTISESKSNADICIINTCSVTGMADHKCRQTIHKLIKDNPGATIVVTGCYAQLKPEEISGIEGVDLVVGTEKKGHIIEYISEYLHNKSISQEGNMPCVLGCPTSGIKTFFPSCSKGDRTRYFLKVQDGCNYFCTYCTIPYARGRSRNPSIASLIKQAQEVAATGGKEIVITGVNIGDFGRTTGETFENLLKSLDKVANIERYRISSIEPNLLTDEIISFCSSSRSFMPHFHIPLQSGSNTVLKLMKRKYDTELFARKISTIHSVIPDAFIGIDVIVGTRGETDELFEETFRFLSELDFAQLHVFSYSERPGTQALKIPYVVSPEVKHERSQRLIELSEQKRKAFYNKYIGTKRKVLVEHALHGETLHGFTDNYIRVELPAKSAEAFDNTIVEVLLEGFNDDKTALVGKITDLK